MFGNPTGLYKPKIAQLDEEIRKLKLELSKLERERADRLVSHYAIRKARYRQWRLKNESPS